MASQRKLLSRLYFLRAVFIMSITVSVIFLWLPTSFRFVEETNYISLNYSYTNISSKLDSLCVTLNIALICMGKGSGILSPMLKSLMYHRQNPLHFHIMVDSYSEQVVRKLFQDWDIPEVNYTFYNVEYRLPEIEWIPNIHYSGAFGLLKLLYPNILPIYLKQVIVLDSDLIFLCDVAELWNMFKYFTQNEFIGLVENESSWYINKPGHWPAVGKGYNMGVMLLDLEKIRRNIHWSRLWHDTVVNHIEEMNKTELGEQDIINSVVKTHPYIVYKINCMYNIQMSDRSIAKQCYGENRNKVKIIHWNSPVKNRIRIRDADFFKNIHQSYVNLDFKLLKIKLHKCL